MMIKLVVEPKTPPLSWPEFCARTPEFSIALDGFVGEGPAFDNEAPRANFNHHEGCDRLATRATCGQVLMAIRQGLFKRFRTHEGPQALVYVNDCDEDVCLTWFLLKHHHWAGQAMNPLLNRLVALEDALDSTAGAYPFPADLPALRELAWVFHPYRDFRLTGGLDRKDGVSYQGVIDAVEARIERFLAGKGEAMPLDTRYERIGGGTGWAMVREVGAHARTGMFADGIQAYCSVRERSPGVWTYTIGRLSPFVPLDLTQLVRLFNFMERCDKDCWGGSNTIIGSPRVAGSKLDLETISNAISAAWGAP
jgi:hypothetical protein